MTTARYLDYAELEAALPLLRSAPRERGVLEMIVRRPAPGEREVLAEGQLMAGEGLVGDRWALAKPRRGEPLTLMGSRVAALLAQTRDRWPLAGDQLFVDFDLSAEHVPPGTRLAIGAAVVEVSAEPHTGCRKFRERYGLDAARFVGSAVGKALNLRGIHARVLSSGTIRGGDAIAALFD
jgi:MOSC domain